MLTIIKLQRLLSLVLYKARLLSPFTDYNTEYDVIEIQRLNYFRKAHESKIVIVSWVDEPTTEYYNLGQVCESLWY